MASDMSSPDLHWSAQLNVVSHARTSRLQGDKIALPQSALEGLLAAAPVVSVLASNARHLTTDFDPYNPYTFSAERHAREALSERQQQLPHPLMFRLENRENGRTVYAGIMEFSAEEGEIELSPFLAEALGLSHSATAQRTGQVTVSGGTMTSQLIKVTAQQLPKGTYVKLRPLSPGSEGRDWKSLLERYLRGSFTTLSTGAVLDVPGHRRERHHFVVDMVKPEGAGICVVDTDIEVDIEAITAADVAGVGQKTGTDTKQRLAVDGGSSPGGLLIMDQEFHGQVLPGEYVDYELKEWTRTANLCVCLETEDSVDVDVLINPIGDRLRSKPRLDSHVFADLSTRPVKRVKLSPTNVDIEQAQTLYISVRGNESELQRPLPYSLTVTMAEGGIIVEDDHNLPPGPDDVVCKNCRQVVPSRTLHLHEAFCYRNNIVCPQCSNVFLKHSEDWKQHWHCPHDTDYGNGDVSRGKHDRIFHPSAPISCPDCELEAFNVPILAQHRTTTCPEKEILCRFCHLVVAQQGPHDPPFTDAEVLISGLTPHELTDGGRTTECHLCGKVVRLRDMPTHLQLHDGERASRPRPVLCINAICGRTIKSHKIQQNLTEQMGMCDDCFGPLYGASFDPDHKALRRRVERRLLQQLMSGCGKAWCHNARWCRTGKTHTNGQDVILSAREALPIVKPVMDQLARGDYSLSFCVDEAAQTRRATAEMLAAEGVYDLEFCVQALEECRNDTGEAKEWLKDRAPKTNEAPPVWMT